MSDPPLSALLLPADLIARGHRTLAVRALEEKGFEVLLEVSLDAGSQHDMSAFAGEEGLDSAIRSASQLLVMHDALPLPPLPNQRAEHPGCDNARTLACLHALRVELERTGANPAMIRAGAFLGTAATWGLVRTLAPGIEEALRRQIADRQLVLAGVPGARDLSRYACRARVQLIDAEGQPAVRKTFRPGAARFHERELGVLQQLGPVSEQLPRLLDHGAGFFVTEYVAPETLVTRPRPDRLLPLAQVRALADFVRMCVGHGYDPIDLKPGGNVFYTRTGLVVVDYEFWRPCDPQTPPEQCLSIAGLPPDDLGDRPWGLDFPFDPYPTKWIQHTGLAPKSLFYDPAWLQAAKRAVYLIRKAPRRAARWLFVQRRTAPQV